MALGYIGPRAQPAVPALEKALQEMQCGLLRELTADRQHLAAQFLRFKEQQRRVKPESPAQGIPTGHERTL
jgi:hypothetical protein